MAGRKITIYRLSEIYELVREYCENEKAGVWKHKARAILQEKNSVRKIGKYSITYYGAGKYSINK